jgi:membrane-bound ClpP family serine protease
MIKQVFAGVVAIGSVAGVASAQTYISMSPPPAAFAPPWVVGASPPTTTATAASSRNSDQREVTIQDVVNGKGNTNVEQDLLAGPP